MAIHISKKSENQICKRNKFSTLGQLIKYLLISSELTFHIGNSSNPQFCLTFRCEKEVSFSTKCWWLQVEEIHDYAVNFQANVLPQSKAHGVYVLFFPSKWSIIFNKEVKPTLKDQVNSALYCKRAEILFAKIHQTVTIFHVTTYEDSIYNKTVSRGIKIRPDFPLLNR